MIFYYLFRVPLGFQIVL